jgi:energy-coupling factor transport system permease protein
VVGWLGMSFSFDLYVQRRSWLHVVDPRVKLTFVFLGTLLMLTFKNLFIMLLSLVITHLIIFSAGVPGHKVKWVWKTMLLINVLIPTLWVIFYPEGPALSTAEGPALSTAEGPTVLFQFWFLKVTALSVVQGVSLALRLDAIAFICFTWLFTTDQASLVRSLVKLGLPFEWGLVLAIGLRYIPTFYGLYTVVSEAQQARALDLTRGNFFTRVRSHLPILVAMIISALRTSEQLARAMESRALGLPRVKRTCLRDIRFRPTDYVYTALLFALFSILLTLRFQFGLGTHPLYLF